MRDLRVAQEKAFATPTPTGVPVPEDPEQSDAWRSFKDHWFQGAYPCEGDECGVRQPTDISPGAYAFLGLDTTYNFTRKFVDVTGKATLFRYAWELNPFVYALSGEVGYRRYDNGDEHRPARPRGRSRAPDRKTPRAGIHSGGLACRLRRRPHRIRDHDELLPHRLRHRQPFRPHDARSPGDRLAQARRRALPRNRRGLGPDLAEVRRRAPDRASHRKSRADGRNVVAPGSALRAARRPDGLLVRGNRGHDGRAADRGHRGAAVRGGRRSERWSCGTGTAGEAGSSGRPAARCRSAPGGPSGEFGLPDGSVRPGPALVSPRRRSGWR